MFDGVACAWEWAWSGVRWGCLRVGVVILELCRRLDGCREGYVRVAFGGGVVRGVILGLLFGGGLSEGLF